MQVRPTRAAPLLRALAVERHGDTQALLRRPRQEARVVHLTLLSEPYLKKFSGYFHWGLLQ